MTTTPPWGTPTSGGTYPPEPGPPMGFFLLVEQLTGSGNTAIWRIDPDPIPAGGDRSGARAAALQLARTFSPHHPYSPQGRTVYRISDDAYVVVVPGMTKTFHFRVSVGERLG